MLQKIKEQISRPYVNLHNFRGRANEDITDKHFEFICAKDQEQYTKQIRDLNITQNKITRFGMEYFPRTNWENLITLSIDKNLIGNRGCKLITTAHLKSLRLLNLDQNEIGSEGILHISKGNWKGLRAITLSKNFIGLNGIHYLTKQNWSQLHSIYIQQNKAKAEQALRFIFLEQKLLTTLWVNQKDIDKNQSEFLNKRLSAHFVNVGYSKMQLKV